MRSRDFVEKARGRRTTTVGRGWTPALRVLLVGSLLAGAPVQAGQGDSPGLPNGDFAQGLAGWSQWSSDGSTAFAAQPGPGAKGQAAFCSLAAGSSARLELAVPVTPGQVVESAPQPGAPGPKVEFGLWVWPGAGFGGGGLWLALEARDASGASVLAESRRWQAQELAPERWTFIATEPQAPFGGRVPSGTLELRYRLHCDGAGPIWFDTALAGPFEFSECALSQASFEDWQPGQGAWETTGDVHTGPTAQTSDGYYGTGFALLRGSSASALSQLVSLAGDPASSPPAVAPGREVEAGLWLHLEQPASLPTTPDPSTWCALEVWGLATPGGAERLLAEGRWYPVADQAQHWRYLETAPVADLGPGETHLRVVVRRSFEADLALDFVQLGERHAIDGNPRRRVGANYVGRYRSPHFPGATTDPQTPQAIWRNWCWIAPPACNGAFEGFFHNPDCATSAGCLRANGRRDVAVTTLAGADQLPLVGAYDSRDPHVVRYHVDLARAAGIDHFIYDYHGAKLAQQLVQQGLEPINEEGWQALVTAAEAPGSDLKLAVMYEPKVHYQGWVAGEPSEAEKLAGITADLVQLSESMAGRRCALRRDGRLVVFVFRNGTCNPAASQCLEEADWLAIHQAVLAQSGEDLFLVGDMQPAAGSVLSGFTRWQLVARSILTHRNYTDVEAGVPTAPVPLLAQLEQHVAGLRASVRDWAREDDVARVGVTTVWPGFDDSGVGGWGASNLLGDDGQPLCVRVAHDFDGAFYATTAAVVLEGEQDWVQVATWNDWNEATAIEPAWHADYLGPFPLGQGPPAEVEQHVFGRLEETRQWIAAFKDRPAGGPSFRRIANEYLSRARRLPAVTLYD